MLKQYDLQNWLEKQHYPRMRVFFSGHWQVFGPGESAWRTVRYHGGLELLEAVLKQSEAWSAAADELDEIEEQLLAWGKAHDYPELSYCSSDGSYPTIAQG